MRTTTTIKQNRLQHVDNGLQGSAFFHVDRKVLPEKEFLDADHTRNIQFGKDFYHPRESGGIEAYAAAQIQMLCDHEVSRGCNIRMMPDVHPGKVGPIGLTMTVGSRILPNLVGSDIGCGMTIARIKQKKIEFQKLDTVIREGVPSGSYNRKKSHRFAQTFDFSRLYCQKGFQKERAALSLGTLGGGNHFIEVDTDHEGNLYVAIHSGSRHLGAEVTAYYLKEGQAADRACGKQVPYELTCLEGTLMEHYLHDLFLVQEFARLNREAILDELVRGMKWKVVDSYTCIHNYVEEMEDQRILRKGAISAKKGERVIIPIHMQAGILLGRGLGNADWNDSSPHGSGRIQKREDVKNQHTVSEYKASMKGVYSTCIGKDTLDEAPFAYRDLEDIRAAITETVTIDTILRPIYNYKAGNKE